MSNQPVSTLQIDNNCTRTTEWRFAPGNETGWHRHEMDYMVVPMVSGQLKMQEPNGKEHIADLTAGVPYFRDLGVVHNVININDFEFVFIEVEFKQS
ncbi:cupin domain-containing protein [Sneathiella sp.]|uniref:cupin domain-containing protein n=1 Tax=Sneathiella sp. TaxID=1964365 RepID=UPI0039E2FFE0